MKQYAIFEGNMERLKKKLTRISNKCSKFGCSFSFKEVGEQFRQVKNEKGQISTLRFVIIEAEGIARLNGWRFIASVEHTSKGNIINRADYSVEVPELFYTINSYCEHCSTRRTRRDTYIVMNEETGEFRQVGKSCLADFTGGLSASNIASYYSFFEELIQGEAVTSGGHAHYYKKETLLLYFAETIRKFGYVRTADNGRSTAQRALGYYLTENGGCDNTLEQLKYKAEMEQVDFNHNSDEAIANTQNALNWIAEQDVSSNYMNNLKVVCDMDYIEYKHLGILASLFATWRRELVREADRRERHEREGVSRFVGNIGERLSISLTSMQLLTSWQTKWGITYLYKMIDSIGNVLVWRTSKWVDCSGVLNIVGTIKAHTEFNSVKQSELTRCKVT